MGETQRGAWRVVGALTAFSILKRIVMGETHFSMSAPTARPIPFQYPQADRDG